ncbi:hypothetical protein [Methanolobus sp.]|uniref:hypothetical protein n=1 Tax=Methanolobus sp. TaxID=1874737 RepID=UPI00272F881F|nr:hypothetical protein [Methanolobus sp.]
MLIKIKSTGIFLTILRRASSMPLSTGMQHRSTLPGSSVLAITDQRTVTQLGMNYRVSRMLGKLKAQPQLQPGCKKNSANANKRTKTTSSFTTTFGQDHHNNTKRKVIE